MFLDPLSNLRQVLVLLPDVVLFAKIDEVYDRLGGKQKQWIDDFDLQNCVSA